MLSLLGIAVLGIGLHLYSSRSTPAPDQSDLTSASIENPTILTGMLTWGGEVRSFVPCGDSEQDAAWVIPATPNIATQLRESYEAATIDRMSYTPVLTTLVADITEPPTDGFGAGYQRGVFVSGIEKLDNLNTCQSDEIVLMSPLAGTTISSPLEISGSVSGTWLFEAEMLAMLTNWNGEIIAEVPLVADGDWMTEDLVPFSGTLEFETPNYGERGHLIIQAANPSGLAQHDKAYEIVLQFETQNDE